MNNMVGYDVKLRYGELSQSLLRNVNEHFISVSFYIDAADAVHTRFVLSVCNDLEKELIEDAIAEFSALQRTDCILMPEVLTDTDAIPLEHLVFAKAK